LIPAESRSLTLPSWPAPPSTRSDWKLPASRQGATEASRPRVREQLRQQEAEAAGRKALKELRSKGITVLYWPPVHLLARPAGPLTYLAGVDLEAHASEPCHAASVNPAGEVVWICTDPAGHPRPEPTWSPPGLSEEQEAEQEAKRMDREALAAAGEARRTFLCKLLSQRIAKGEVLQHVARVFVDLGNTLGWEDYELAWGLLDVAGQEADDGGGRPRGPRVLCHPGTRRGGPDRPGLGLRHQRGDSST